MPTVLALGFALTSLLLQRLQGARTAPETRRRCR